jgi:hypothetical protein
MFSTKQSDIFYNDETKEMFVCKVSAISAERCEDNITVYGALPLIYKINKADNYKTLVYPKNLNTFLTDTNSDLYKLTPTCAISGTNFDSITKPLVNYNTATSRYSVTFLGRYSTDDEGLGLNNYIFQDINSDFYLLDANIYIPKDKDVTADIFTFENGYLNSDLYIVGNTIRNDKPSWFNPADTVIERSTDYQIAPMYVQATSSLGFNLILCDPEAALHVHDALTGNTTYPFLYSGGFITYNPKYVAYDPEYTIRVDFTARSFNVPSPTAYGSTQSVGTSATRWIQQYIPPSPGEGFCVSFFKNPPVSSYVIPNGIGSTLGYAKAGFSPNEVAGTAHATDGLYVHNDWNPNTGVGIGSVAHPYLGPAESFLGVGFDIGGNFATTAEEKDDWYDGNPNSWTATPCSVGIRASSYYDTQVLTAIAMNTVAASAVPMHTSAADAEFVDYRIDLSSKGNTVTIYNKLTSATDYNTILEYRLNKAEGCVGVGIGSSHSFTYQPWYGMQSSYQQATNTLPLLNVGLSFTTSDKVSRFELHKFEVTGVKVNNPWVEKKDERTGRFAKETTASVTKRIDYLQESSKNLRKRLINVESDDLVDIEMVGKSSKAKTKPQITLCDGSNPEEIEEDVNIRITGISPGDVDTAIRVGELPGPTIITGGPTIIPGTGGVDIVVLKPHKPESEVFQCPAQEQFDGKEAWPGTHAKTATNTRYRELKFGLGTATGVVVFGFDPYTIVDRFQVFAGPDNSGKFGPPKYDENGHPENLVIDTGFHGKTGYPVGSSLDNPRTFFGEFDEARQEYKATTGDSNRFWSPEQIKNQLSFVGRGIPHVDRYSYYAFNKEWAHQIAYIKVWAPTEGTRWQLDLFCPDAGPTNTAGEFIGNNDYFPGWIGQTGLGGSLSDAQKERGLIGTPIGVSTGDKIPGTKETNHNRAKKKEGDALLEGSSYKGIYWPHKNRYREYTTGAGMFAQGGYPLDINGRPIGASWNEKDVPPERDAAKDLG